VPDKSARCQSIRPVRLPLPSIWSAASGAGTTVRPAGKLCGSMPPVRVPQRHLITAMRSGPGQVAGSPLEQRPGPTSDDNRRLDRLPLIRPAQVKATIAGRLIWHRTTPLRGDRRVLCTLLAGRRFELDHQFGRNASAVFYLDALRPGPFPHLSGVQAARRSPAPATGRSAGATANPPPSLHVGRQRVPQLLGMLSVRSIS